MKNVLVIIFVVCFVLPLSAQTPADWWYFGNKAGMHFESSGPVGVNDGEMVTGEGCASISNTSGNLQFYTDGSDVWNANHQPLLNGSGLLGNSSASQSAIIVPVPTSSSLYLIITSPVWVNPDSGMRYSLVDMTLDGGLGGVVIGEKNVLIMNGISENVCVVRHAASDKFWLVAHKSDSDSIFAFEINSTGINLTPVISQVPPIIAAKVGCIKGSISGKLIGYASYFSGSNLKIMKFDNGTGQITNVVSLVPVVSNCYGIEFSPDESRVYVSSFSNGSTVQFNIEVFDSTAIATSEVLLSSGASGQLQLGPDGIIYQAKNASQYISGILNPDELGALCNYQDSAVFIGPQLSQLGLPPFVASFFNVSISAVGLCLGDSTLFSMDTSNVDSVFWNFGDPSSGAFNTSSNFFPGHIFTDTGTFDVRLIAHSDTLVDTAFQTIRIYPRQNVDLGEDTTICRGESLLLDVSQPWSQFLWQDSSTADTFLTSGETYVKVTVFGTCDTVSDSLMIVYDDSISIELGPDTLLCGGQAYTINSNINTSAEVEWSTGDSISSSIDVIESGDYFLVASNTCGIVTDSVEVIFKPVPGLILLPPDTINCFDNDIVLTHPDLDSTSYVWSDSSTKKTYTVDTTETVWLAAFNECGSTIDTINIIFNGEIISELGEDTNICDKDSILLNAFSPGAEYIWSTGDTIDSIYSGTESQLYVVTVTQGLCTTIESKRVELSDVFCPSIDCELDVANVITPNGDGMNDTWKVVSNCDITEFNLRIYNRWGQLVFSSNQVNIAWDGTVFGSPAADGVYFYELEFKDTVIVDVDREDFRGSITLIRN